MRGLYLITNDDPLELLLAKLERAMATREVAILQYRRKKVAKEDQYYEVEYMKRDVCRISSSFVINDDLELAEKYGLGVHLGQTDGSIADAVARLPQGVVIGSTCANSLELAEKAIKEVRNLCRFRGIYVATETKPEAGHIGLETLKQAKTQLNVPICAIGGLTVENSKEAIEAGADLCAVISDILGLPMNAIPDRLNAWTDLFEQTATL